MTDKNLFEYTQKLIEWFWQRRGKEWRDFDAAWAKKSGNFLKGAHDADLLTAHVLSRLEHFEKYKAIDLLYDDYNEAEVCRCYVCARPKIPSWFIIGARFARTIHEVETFLLINNPNDCPVRKLHEKHRIDIECCGSKKYSPLRPSKYFADTFENFYANKCPQTAEARNVMKADGIGIDTGFLHDFRLLGERIADVVEAFERYGSMVDCEYFPNISEEFNGECWRCSIKGQGRKPCFFKVINYKPPQWRCWREHDMDRKKWKTIPATNWTIPIGVKNKSARRDKLYPVDTLYERRNELEKQSLKVDT